MPINKEIINEIKRLAINSKVKREVLLINARRKTITKKKLNMASGILALYSAGTIASVLLKFADNDTLQIIAALTAFISGIISLTLSSYFGEEEISRMFEGSSKYLLIREEAIQLLILPNKNNNILFEEIKNLKLKYSNLDTDYSKYINVKERRSRSLTERIFNGNSVTISDYYYDNDYKFIEELENLIKK